MNKQLYTFPEPYTHLVGKPTMEKPDGSTYRMIDDYKEDEREYQQHIANLQKIEASDSFREAYKGKDIEHEPDVTFELKDACECDFCNCVYERKDYSSCEHTIKIAYPLTPKQIKTAEEILEQYPQFPKEKNNLSSRNCMYVTDAKRAMETYANQFKKSFEEKIKELESLYSESEQIREGLRIDRNQYREAFEAAQKGIK